MGRTNRHPGHAEGEWTFPRTRYQGSKRKLCPWIRSCLADLEFESVLDAFGGTGSVAHLLKSHGKSVTYNDILRSNEQIGLALIGNDRVRLAADRVEALLKDEGRGRGPTFIADHFSGIYFTDAENAWLDRVCRRIGRITDVWERAIAWYALIQAALVKRPYNLFHRRNLYMRTADVPRSFGNKKTWDTPFEVHFRKFVDQANAAVVDSAGRCRAIRSDAAEIEGAFDLVYIDPPYINRHGSGVDYAHFYHFLEGMLDYDRWPERIDWESKHLRLKCEPSPWTNANAVRQAFARVFDRFRDSILVVSYRSDGIPTIPELTGILRRFKRRVVVHEHGRYQYALSKNGSSAEFLLVGM